MTPVDVLGLQVEAASGGPIVLLREHDAPHRVLPIFVGAPEAVAIGLALGHEVPPRPLTHDLLATFIHDLHAHVERVEVTELHDGTFHAALTVQGPNGERRIDSRPSDAIALALRVDAPVFVSEDVLDEAGAILAVVGDEDDDDDDVGDEDPVDPETIEAEVARFRTLLDDLDLAQLAEDKAAEPPAGDPDEPTEPRDTDTQDDDPDA
jgi:uncharacterized protein